MHPRLVALSDTIGLAIVAVVIALLLTLGIGPWNVTELGSPDNVDNIADILHPNIHQKVGQGDGTNANPNGNGNGGQIHGIGNVPGQNADSTPGVANLANVHGGIGCKNKNVAEPAGGCG